MTTTLACPRVILMGVSTYRSATIYCFADASAASIAIPDLAIWSNCAPPRFTVAASQSYGKVSITTCRTTSPGSSVPTGRSYATHTL